MTFASPVLILGAGINGAALARELVLNGVSVVVVDRQDLAAGTTAYSSRLIHGGLRYLEYGDFGLVRESLAERTRWLRLAPHFVRPLRLFIPVENRWGGFGTAIRNFLGLRPKRTPATSTRGLATIRAGLWLYDRYARDQSLPRRQAHRLPSPNVPGVNPSRYRWACAYYDAQLRFPERFTLELLVDARQIARGAGVAFELFTYHRANRRGESVDITALDGRQIALSIRPAAIVNATGAWVDSTLHELGVPSEKLIGGTKGSHFVTFRRELVELLDGNGVYVEAGDGRPVFILPFGDAALIGTTDEPFTGDPDTARATTEEMRYLIDAVRLVFPQVALSEADIEVVYCGVRPLPAVGPKTPAAISRRHWLHEHEGCAPPFYSIVGGKLTTCRSLAESSTQFILKRLGQAQIASSSDRPLPGAAPHPQSSDGEFANSEQDLFSPLRMLYGDQAPSVLADALVNHQKTLSADDRATPEMLDGTRYPLALARYMIQHEWVRRLDDFVERRLMLLYHRPLTRRCLAQLADALVAAGLLDHELRDEEVAATMERLRERFRKRVE
jgi:glycerol-3-phosphate dehydrogenase